MQSALRLDSIIAIRRFSLSAFSVSFDWLAEQLFSQKDQVVLWVPIFFSLGIGVYFLLPFEPPLALGLVFWGMALAVHVIMHRSLRFVSLATFLMVSGFLISSLRTSFVDTPILDKKIKIVDVSGQVVSIEPMEEGGGSRIVLSQLDIAKLSATDTPRKIRLRLRADEGIQVGQRVKVLASLTPPSAPVVPGGFDFRRYLYFQGIGAVGFIFKAPEVLEAAPPRFMVIEQMRGFIADRIQSALEPQQASIALALIVGQKNALSEEDRQALRDAGLAHMLAISGLHVGLVSGALFFFLRFGLAAIPPLALRYPIKKIAAIFAFAGAVFYMLLAGATVPTQRAVLMIGIMFFAILMDRSPISLRLVAVSALVVLLLKPESLLSASFQMSFAAVTCLVFFYDSSRDFWSRQYSQIDWFRKVMLYFLGVCITTVIASIATAPFALYHFGQVSFIGSLANLVAVPLFAFLIMPFALIGTVLTGLGLEYWPLQIVGAGIELMLDVAYWAADLPGAILRSSVWSFWSFVLFVASGLWIIMWKSWGKFLAVAPLCCSFILAQQYVLPDILVSASHKLFAFKSGDNIYASSGRNDKYVLERWEEFYGLEEGSSVALPHKGSAKNLREFYQCGEHGCRFEIKDQKISYVRSPYVQREDCAWADVVISVYPFDKGGCSARVIIDKFDSWRSGAHALWVSNSDVRIEHVAETSSKRPWSAYGQRD